MALTRPKYSQIFDTDWKQSVELATTTDVGNLFLANVQPNTIDGVSVQTNYRILVKDQTNGAQNGIYLVRSAGSGSNGWWTRSLDAAQSSFVTAGLTVSVISGSSNGGKEFKLTTPDPIILDTTVLTFTNPFAAGNPGGANTYVQFNDTGSVFSGTPGFTFNKFTNAVSISGNVSSGNLTVGGLLTVNGNINIGSIPNTVIGSRIQGDFSNVTLASRVMIQTSVTNSQTQLALIPNGNVGVGATVSGISVEDNTSIATGNGSNGAFNIVQDTEVRLISTRRGTGSYLPLTFLIGGFERVKVDTGGNVLVGTANPTAYSNLTVGHSTPSTSSTTGALVVAGGAGVVGNISVGTAGAISGAFHTFIGNITQTSSGGTAYINTTGNVLAGGMIAGTSTIGGLTLTGGAVYRNGGETQVIGGGSQTTRAMLRLGNGQGAVLYGSGPVAAPNVPNTGIVIHGGDGNIQIFAPNTITGSSRIQLQAQLVEIQGNLTPVGNLAYSIGNVTNQWNTVYAANIVTNTLQLSSGNISGSVNISGNITANSFIGSSANISGNITTTGSINVAGNIYVNNAADPLGTIYSMDDISSQFDGIARSFTIKVNDGTVYSVRNPYQISLQIGGVSVTPTRYITDYFNLPELAVFNRGFYLQTGSVAANASIITGNNFSTGGNTIVFATAPTAGMSFYSTIRTNSDPVPTFTFKQTPFSAINIMLGP